MGLLENSSFRFGAFVLCCAVALVLVICVCTCYFDRRTDAQAEPQKIRVFAHLRRRQQLAPVTPVKPIHHGHG